MFQNLTQRARWPWHSPKIWPQAPVNPRKHHRLISHHPPKHLQSSSGQRVTRAILKRLRIYYANVPTAIKSYLPREFMVTLVESILWAAVQNLNGKMSHIHVPFAPRNWMYQRVPSEQLNLLRLTSATVTPIVFWLYPTLWAAPSRFCLRPSKQMFPWGRVNAAFNGQNY